MGGLEFTSGRCRVFGQLKMQIGFIAYDTTDVGVRHVILAFFIFDAYVFARIYYLNK